MGGGQGGMSAPPPPVRNGQVWRDERGSWRDGRGRFVPPPSAPIEQEQFRVTVFGTPRGPWRNSRAEATRDAIAGDLASWDASRREHYLAVPVAIARRVIAATPGGARAGDR